MHFEIPGKPIPQTRARISKNFMYDPLFNVKKNLRTIVKEQLPSDFKPFLEPIEVEVTFSMPLPKAWPKYKKELIREGTEIPYPSSGDIDNLLKMPFDALNGIVWEDDRLIWKVSAKKVWALEGKTCFEIKVT